MQAVILAAGPGTRLKPFTDALPKPMLPIGSKPLLEINIEYLKCWGINEVILAIGYKKESIRHYFNDGSRLGVRLIYSIEQQPLGTAGAVKQAARWLTNAFVVLLGDGLADIDYQALLEYHQEAKAAGTMVVFEKRMIIPYGVLGMEVSTENDILDLEEKPELTFKVNTGIVILEPSSLDYMTPGEFLRMPDFFLRLRERGEKVVAYHHKGNWMDIGQNIEQYLTANQEIIEGRISFNPALRDIIFGADSGEE